MNLVADFTPDRPVIATVGVWDPFMPTHGELFTELRASADAQDRHSCALLLDPHPATYVSGSGGWPEFDDLETRRRLIEQCGVSTAVIRFEAADLAAATKEFLDLLVPWCTLSSLWLGFKQSLGSGPQGSNDAIVAETQQRGIELRRLDFVANHLRGAGTQRSLAFGCIQEAAALVGRFPTRHRPLSTLVEAYWHAGTYRALGVRDGIMDQAVISIAMQAVDGSRASYAWPDPDIESLVFVGGPGDGTYVQRIPNHGGIL